MEKKLSALQNDRVRMVLVLFRAMKLFEIRAGERSEQRQRVSLDMDTQSHSLTMVEMVTSGRLA
jgi:hypothetical protein